MNRAASMRPDCHAVIDRHGMAPSSYCHRPAGHDGKHCYCMADPGECAYDANSRESRVREHTETPGPLTSLAAEIRAVNIANGWEVIYEEDWYGSAHKIPAILALITSEMSEALEAFRNDAPLAAFGEELADTIIRVLDCAAGLGLNMDAAVRAKIEKNKTRGYRHGGKRV